MALTISIHDLLPLPVDELGPELRAAWAQRAFGAHLVRGGQYVLRDAERGDQIDYCITTLQIDGEVLVWTGEQLATLELGMDPATGAYAVSPHDAVKRWVETDLSQRRELV